ncbi:MAG: ATP-binding protein [Promethearchaeota archaeon]
MTIVILILVSCLLIYYFEVILRTTILVTHFFYIPSILSCLWWQEKGLIIPGFLATILIVVHSILYMDLFSPDSINNFLRGGSLIIMGIVVSLLSEEVSKNELEYNKIMLDLRRSNEDLRQFAYVASHDLQEPLRAIVSFSQLLEEKYQDELGKNGKEFIYFITEGAKKMNILIKDLLTYSRITTNAKPSKLINLDNVMKDVLFNLQESIKESDAIITYDKMPILEVDKTQFIQLFQNLISNSIKFRRKEPPKIYIKVKESDKEWLFSIKDNGIGIESKYFDHLFNIFYRLHTKEEYPGTGIGLPICKKIVQRYGGEIWVESEYGKGSIFFFTIPKKKIKNSIIKEK